ncbi:MAG: ABC transporter permease [Candidatus Hadarchaeum sp.]|uniref:ABC transporter permease n=1 Tax=Candidatus Hadarchaeum sp. TaxID=2883567 RepID=UPI003D0CDBDE
MLKGSLVLILRNLTQRKLRSSLTTLGVIIGIAAIVGMVSATQGISNSIGAQLEKLQGDRILITPGGRGGIFSTGTTGGLTEKDVEIIQSINGVSIAYGQLQTSALVVFGEEAQGLTIVGISPSDFERLDTLGLEAGRYLKDSDRYATVIGNSVAHEKFQKEIGLRKKLVIRDVEFQVVGIMNKAGGALMTTDATVYLPKDAMREVFNLPEDRVNSIVVGVKPDADINAVAERISEALRRSHRVTKNNEDFTVITPDYVKNIVGQITGLLSILLGGIAGISLIVGSIGITNIMFVTVTERTREIGVMKALGSTNRDILMLFVLESGIISLIGGVIGVFVGLGLGEGLIFLSRVAISGTTIADEGLSSLQAGIAIIPELIAGAIVLSFVVGIIAGFLPARKAANLNPIEALRYE